MSWSSSLYGSYALSNITELKQENFRIFLNSKIPSSPFLLKGGTIFIKGGFQDFEIFWRRYLNPIPNSPKANVITIPIDINGVKYDKMQKKLGHLPNFVKP